MIPSPLIISPPIELPMVNWSNPWTDEIPTFTEIDKEDHQPHWISSNDISPNVCIQRLVQALTYLECSYTLKLDEWMLDVKGLRLGEEIHFSIEFYEDKTSHNTHIKVQHKGEKQEGGSERGLAWLCTRIQTLHTKEILEDEDEELYPGALHLSLETWDLLFYEV